MSKGVKSLAILAVLVFAVLLLVFWTTDYLRPGPPMPIGTMDRKPPEITREDVELFFTVKTVISSINVVFLVFLMVTYVDIYRKTKSEFTIGLMIFSLVLLLYAFSSNPLIHRIFGFRMYGLGPFTMLPDMFTCVALIILLYLTIKY
jgi:hypothetical protein